MTIYIMRSFLQVGFRFQYPFINFVWLSFDFFPFSWSVTIYFFVALYSCVCSCSKNAFYLKLFTFLVLILLLTCFAPIDNVNKLEQQPHCACVETKSKQKQNQVTSLFDLAHKHAIVSLNDCFTAWRHRQREDFLSVIY